MKTEWQINVDFQNARQQAQRLDDIANDIERGVVRRMEQTHDRIRTSWRGDNANLYLGKQSKVANEIRQTAAELHSIANDIRTIAQAVYEAEMRALAIIQQH